MAYGGDYLRALMEQRRQGSFGEMGDFLERRKKRRSERETAIGQYNSLRQLNSIPTQAPQNEGIDFSSQMREQMNNGGQDLPPQDRNPYSPTGGQGFNLNNMLRKKRNNYY